MVREVEKPFLLLIYVISFFTWINNCKFVKGNWSLYGRLILLIWIVLLSFSYIFFLNPIHHLLFRLKMLSKHGITFEPSFKLWHIWWYSSLKSRLCLMYMMLFRSRNLHETGLFHLISWALISSTIDFLSWVHVHFCFLATWLDPQRGLLPLSYWPTTVLNGSCPELPCTDVHLFYIPGQLV